MRAIALIFLMSAVSVGPVAAQEHPARPRLCPDDLPDGVHLPAQRGCPLLPAAPQHRGDGFRSLGDGVSVRVGGRVGADYGVVSR